MKALNILGVRVDVIDKHQLELEIETRVRQAQKEYLANVNINAINLAQSDSRFREFLNRSPIVYCDGEGVRVGARLLGVRLPPRIVLTYWLWDLAALCQERGFSLYLLGGGTGSAEEAARNLQQRFPSLKIAGCHHGHFSKSGPENDEVIARINRAQPNILIVCFGMPLQEHWINTHLHELKINLALFGGATIEYASGRKLTAPGWMSNHGMEWLYRLFQEPQRLWRRYLVGNPAFMTKVLLQRARHGAQR